MQETKALDQQVSQRRLVARRLLGLPGFEGLTGRDYAGEWAAGSLPTESWLECISRGLRTVGARSRHRKPAIKEWHLQGAHVCQTGIDITGLLK